MTVTALKPGRRVGALVALKLASALLRGGTSLYRRSAIPRPLLRAVLSASQALERAGALMAFGGRNKWQRSLNQKEENYPPD